MAKPILLSDSNRVSLDIVDGQRLISGAMLCLLGMPSKRGGNIPFIALLHLFIPFKLSFTSAIRWILGAIPL